MESKVVYTEEMDDLEEAVEEIFEAFSDFEIKKNSLAIIFMEEDVEYLELYEGLREKWDFPIIGCTATALLMSGQGYHSDGINVMVMTGDDVNFVAGVTDELTRDNYEESINSLYNDLTTQLGEEEKLIISYGVCVTAKNHVAADDLLEATNKISHGKPIIGGLAADRFNFEDTRVFCNDKLVKNGQVMALIAGNLDPHFFHVTSIENRASEQSFTITKSEHNEVFCLDGEPMMDVLAREGFEVGKSDVLREYLLTPFIVTIPQPDGGEVRVARNLSMINHENKSGVFLGAMPEGSKLQIGMINRDRVKETVVQATNAMLEHIKSSGRKYSTVICTSCAARFLALSSRIENEVTGWVETLPDNLNMIGMYSNGEFCPVPDETSGMEYNTFHNFTLVMLLL
ncbi:MAG: FIST N-terminal domain-containing protein [Eubacterium sp.]|nr:FIST N-terminal domain-containing protein [Eubacterium sp.]